MEPRLLRRRARLRILRLQARRAGLAAGSWMTARSSDADLAAVLAPSRMEAAFSVEPAIGVRPEIVAQALQQIRRPASAPQAVTIGERRGKCRHRHALLDRKRDDAAPGGL